MRRLPSPDLDPVFDRDVYLLNQRAFTISSQYEVWSDDGKPLLYVERPTYPVRSALAYVLAFIAAGFVVSWGGRGAGEPSDVTGALVHLGILMFSVAVFLVVSMSARPLRHVTIYRDESRREPLLRILQEQRVAVLRRTYRLTTTGGEMLARLRKVYVHNLVRKRWYVDDEHGQALAMAIEDSVVLSLLRRVLGTFFGFLRTNFLIQTPGGDVLGEFNRKFTVLDRYVLDLSADVERQVDRRIALALGIMLDTGERR